MNVITEFTIILIDDDIVAMSDQKDEIIRYLKEDKGIANVNFHEVHVEDSTFVDEVYGHLSKNVDMVLIDNSMLVAEQGLKVAKDIQERFVLIDILLYSSKEITVENYRDLSQYTQIHTHHEKFITDITKTLIDSNLAKWDDVVFLRGIVISESIEVELKMNEILMKFFEIPEEKKASFEALILGNFSVAISAKKEELRGVIIAAGLEGLWTDVSNKIKDLQEDRNKLAHGKIDPDNNNRFILGKSDEIFDKEKIIKIFSNIKVIETKLSEIYQALEDQMASSTESGEQSESEPTQ